MGFLSRLNAMKLNDSRANVNGFILNCLSNLTCSGSLNIMFFEKQFWSGMVDMVDI